MGFRPRLELLEDRLAPATLTVNTTADNTTDTTVLTLRDAITLVNNGGNPNSLGQATMPAGWASQISGSFGNDTIKFDIANGGVQTITLSSSLPTLTASNTTIDGTTEPGYTSTPVIGTGGTVGVDAVSLPKFAMPEIAISGGVPANANPGFQSGGLDQVAGSLSVSGNASGILIQGLAIYDCVNAITQDYGSSGTGTATFKDLLVGALPDGGDPMLSGPGQGNYGFGFVLRATATVNHCYVAHNGYNGIDGAQGGATVNSTLLATYNEVFGNGWNDFDQDGIDVDGHNSIVRYNLTYNNTVSNQNANGPGAANGTGGSGIEVGSSGDGTTAIQGDNLVEDNTSRGNQSAGVEIRKGNLDNTVDRNLLTENYVGISVRSEAGRAEYGNQLTQNSIYNNTWMGIDLNANPNLPDGYGDMDQVPPGGPEGNGGTPGTVAFDGPTPNSYDYTSSGTHTTAFSNQLQTVPTNLVYSVTNNQITITGTLDGQANTTYLIEFFASASLDPAGNPEGQTYLGSTTVTTGDTSTGTGNGDGTVSFTAAFTAVAGENVITATATGPGSDSTSTTPPAQATSPNPIVPWFGANTSEFSQPATPATPPTPPPCNDNYYPFSSNNPLTSTPFNESTVFAAASSDISDGTFKLWYNDEHAMALGVRQLTVKSTGTLTNGSNVVPISITTGSVNPTTGLLAGDAVAGQGIPAGTTITSVSSGSITLSNNATASVTETLIFTSGSNVSVSPLTTDPGSVTNPAVGVGSTQGGGAPQNYQPPPPFSATPLALQGGTDASGRPMFPSLYITDITGLNSAELDSQTGHMGDWQYGGIPIPPSDVFGTWKAFTETVDNTTSPASLSLRADSDPSPNGWNLDGGDSPPPGLANGGYGAEARWNLNDLARAGLVQPGHTYRFYVIVHDGDQNKTGGDCGQACFNFYYAGPVTNPSTISGFVYNDANNNGIKDSGEAGIAGVTINLLDANNNLVTSVFTGSDGSYKFVNLPPGMTYKIAEVQPAGYFDGKDTLGSGADGTASNDVFTITIPATGNVSGTGYDFGEITASSQAISTVSKPFNGTAISAGNTLWFSSVFQVGGLGPTGSNDVTLRLANSSITITTKASPGHPSVTYTIPVPNALITFRNSVTDPSATTSFDATDNLWTTTVGKKTTHNYFLSAVSWPVPANNLAGASFSWTGTFLVDTRGVNVSSWAGAAAVYNTTTQPPFPADPNAIGVKPVDGPTSMYNNADPAGTPENTKTQVIAGALGNGGTAYIGGYTSNGTPRAAVVPNLTPVDPTETFQTTAVVPQLAAGSTSLAGAGLSELLGSNALHSRRIQVVLDLPRAAQVAATRALAHLDAELRPLGVQVVQVGAGHASATAIHISIASTSPIGGMDQGVLGSFNVSGGSITMISGWNWYYGANPRGIEQNQFDFQTALTHELGHLLGLGESSDPSSVMYLYLSAGEINRTLTAADLGAIRQELQTPSAEASFRS